MKYKQKREETRQTTSGIIMNNDLLFFSGLHLLYVRSKTVTAATTIKRAKKNQSEEMLEKYLRK